jgi:hypothetical protein
MFFCIIALVVSLVSETVMPMLHVLKEMQTGTDSRWACDAL